MYLMYVDESGDTGLVHSPTRYFCLSGLVVHESRWRDFINSLISFRRTLNNVYGLPLRSEIHAAEFINSKPVNLDRHIRLAILRNTLDELAKMNFISITNVIVDKHGKPAEYDVFQSAWTTLFQRFENTLGYGNFPGRFRNDFGMVFTDAVGGKKLTRLVRRMSVFNFVPHDPRFGGGARNIPIRKIIEDAHSKDSEESLPIQMCDVSAYFLYQYNASNSYIRRQRAQKYFERLLPVLNRQASRSDPLGIVRL